MTQDKRKRVFLALGSNLGDRAQTLARARQRLQSRLELGVASTIYETAPWGYARQPPFLNQVVEVHTEMAPEALLRWLKSIEAEFGQRPALPNGPRRLDLDILSIGDIVIETDELQLPHPRLAERAFVLVPWEEIAPDYTVPGLDKQVGQLMRKVEVDGVWRWRPSTPASAMAELRLRDKQFEWGSRTYLMGILNLTPDSFSGDGLLHE